MQLFICPGFHHPDLTTDFLRRSQVRAYLAEGDRLWLPPALYPAYSGFYVRTWMQTCLGAMTTEPVILIGFSAGVVGAIAAALSWHQQGGTIAALVALDGWGVPLTTAFPCYRLSHDYATHLACRYWGLGVTNFYATPAVAHLDLWRSPDDTWGQLDPAEASPTLTAAHFLQHILQPHLPPTRVTP